MNYFSNFHPAVVLFYFIAGIALNMVIFDPVILLISLLSQAFLYLYLKGAGEGIKFVLQCLVVIVFCGGINMLVNHRGTGVLCYMGGLPVTLECLFYGCMTGVLLAASLLLFGSYNHVMTSEKIMCLFGNLFPHFSLIFSMALRLVPKMKRDYKMIRENHRLQKGILTALIGLALEDSLETGVVMEYRGYAGGIKARREKENSPVRRTSIYSRGMKGRDFVLLAVMILLLGAGTGMYLLSGTGILVFPYIEYSYDGRGIAAYILFALFMNAPMLINLREELKWKRIVSRI